VRVWRKHGGLTLDALAAGAGIARSDLTEIEAHEKPGRLDALIKIAAALGVSLDDLAAWLRAGQAALARFNARATANTKRFRLSPKRNYAVSRASSSASRLSFP